VGNRFHRHTYGEKIARTRKEETDYEYRYSKSPDSRYWRELYRAALYEVDKSKLPQRIAEAEKAVVLRARELFQAAGDNGEETEALDDVIYALHALGSNYQHLGVS
jgi:hypothetical protein